jgi:acetoin utilization deacetylase AcuC-like enzyme
LSRVSRFAGLSEFSRFAGLSEFSRLYNRRTVKAFYSDLFVLPLPETHRFPMAKYSRLRERLVAEQILSARDLHVPEAITWNDLRLVHDAAYIDANASGTLTREMEGDRLGRLRLTIAGLRERDRTVFDACRNRGLPVAVAMSGGYAPDIEAIVTIHLNTIKEAVRLDRSQSSCPSSSPERKRQLSA